MGVETLAGKEALRLLRRNPEKYARGVSGLYMLSLADPGIGRLARASYFFLRHVDDALDGGGVRISDPLFYVLSMRDQIATDEFRDTPPIVNLAQYALVGFNERAQKDDDPKQDLLDVIDAIVFDYERSRSRQPLSTKELDGYYRRAFFPVVNLMLIGLGSKFRATDIPELSFCQGRVYTVRDLKEDWMQGIVNIPDEILSRGGLSPSSPFQTIRGNDAVGTWFSSELSKSKPELLLLLHKLKASSERLTYLMCNGLVQPMLKLIDRYTQTR